MPKITVLSGPNGAGKSTLAPYLLRDTFGISEYVNADTIAQGLSAFAPQRFALEAGRIMLSHLRSLAGQRKDFAFETTLATKSYARWLRELQAGEFEFNLIFLYLQSADLAIERVRERVRRGGHDIPVQVVERRYHRGIDNFRQIYQPFADRWRILDVSYGEPVDVAFGDRNQTQIVDQNVWKQILTKN